MVTATAKCPRYSNRVLKSYGRPASMLERIAFCKQSWYEKELGSGAAACGSHIELYSFLSWGKKALQLTLHKPLFESILGMGK